MNDSPASQPTCPGIPLTDNWIPLTYPVNANIGMAPRLSDSVMIDVQIVDEATSDSVGNVEKQVAKSGGKALHGWSLTQFHHTRENTNIIEATPHAVWVRPDGTLLDVTPSATSNKLQTCFITEEKTWKIMPNTIFYAPSKISEATRIELRQILAAKHVTRKYMQKNHLVAGTKCEVDMKALHSFSRNLVKDLDSDIVFQFVRFEMMRQRLLTA